MNISLRAIVFAVLVMAHPAAAETTIQPAVTVSEEYNDNIYLAPNNPIDDYITRIIPSVRFGYQAPLWDWNVAYTYDYRNYAKKTVIDDTTHTLNLVHQTRIVKEFLFLDLTDNYYRVSKDIIRDFTQESLFYSQTDHNRLVVRPWMRFIVTSRTTGTIGYEYRNLWYKDPAAIDKTDRTAFLAVGDELSLNTILSARVNYTRTENKVLDYHRLDASVGPQHVLDSNGSSIWLTIGNTWFDSGKGLSVSQVFWDVGINLIHKTYLLSFNSALTYVDDPYSLSGLRRVDRYVGSFRKQSARYGFSATAGLWEYRSVISDHLENSRTNLGGSISYDLSSQLRGSYSLNIDRYEDNQMRTFYMLYQNGLRFDYSLSPNTTLAASYRYAHGYSPDPANYYMNYDNNRVTVELTKKF